MTHYRWTVAILCFLFAVSDCRRTPESEGPKYSSLPASGGKPIYHFAVYPLHNPAKLMKAYQPLVDHVNAHLTGCQLELEASRDYADFEGKFSARKPELILPNAWQTLQAMRLGYSVIAIEGDSQDFKGIFVVRKDGNIRKPSDLKGKPVSYPSPTAFAACILPQYFLHTHGINVTRDIENRYVGSQASSIMNVYLKNTVAGATWPTPWRVFQKEHPSEAADLMVLWETETLVNNSVMARNDLPEETRKQFRQELVGLQETEEGRMILAGMETGRFSPASNEDFDVVRTFLNRFERDVRKIETQ